MFWPKSHSEIIVFFFFIFRSVILCVSVAIAIGVTVFIVALLVALVYAFRKKSNLLATLRNSLPPMPKMPSMPSMPTMASFRWDDDKPEKTQAWQLQNNTTMQSTERFQLLQRDVTHHYPVDSNNYRSPFPPLREKNRFLSQTNEILSHNYEIVCNNNKKESPYEILSRYYELVHSWAN